MIIIYTDGSSKGNPGPGGWGCHIIKGSKTHEIYGRSEMTTNNEMELLAAIKALEFFPESEKIVLRTDSNYVLKGITEWIIGWKKRDWKNSKKETVKNLKLWKRLDILNQKHSVKWEKVKGHSGDFGNDRADYLATFED